MPSGGDNGLSSGQQSGEKSRETYPFFTTRHSTRSQQRHDTNISGRSLYDERNDISRNNQRTKNGLWGGDEKDDDLTRWDCDDQANTAW